MCVRNEIGAEEARRDILCEAITRERPLLPSEEADAEIHRLVLKVGELEERNGYLSARNAELERVVKAMCRGCALRLVGSCDWTCRGRDFSDTEGLRPVDLTARQEVLCGQA